MDPSLRNRELPSGVAALTLGVLMMIGGFLALTVTSWATVAAVVVIGGFLIAAGAGQIAGSFMERHRQSRGATLLSGVLCALVGVSFLVMPGIGAMALTTLLAIYFVVGGTARFIGCIRRPGAGRGWGIAAGLAALALGVITLLSWPISSLWLLGTLVGVDFLFIGANLIALGVATRTLARGIAAEEPTVGRAATPGPEGEEEPEIGEAGEPEPRREPEERHPPGP